MSETPPKFYFHSKKAYRSKFKKFLRNCRNLTEYSDIKRLFHVCFKSEIYPSIPFGPHEDTLKIYRITKMYDNININNSYSFSYHPNPGLNRANLPGHPVFYGAENIGTAFGEMKNSIRPGEIFYLSKWEINFKRDVLFHVLISNTKTLKFKKGSVTSIAKLHIQQFHNIARYLPKHKVEGLKYLIIKMGDLFTRVSPSWYHVTASYAHKILYDGREKNPLTPISILAYPSVATNNTSVNYAIHPDIINTLTSISGVLELQMGNEGSASVLRKGKVLNNNTIEWYHPNYTIKSIDNCIVHLPENRNLLGVSVDEVILMSSSKPLRVFLTELIHGYMQHGIQKSFLTSEIFSTRETIHQVRYKIDEQLIIYKGVETPLSGIDLTFTVVEN